MNGYENIMILTFTDITTVSYSLYNETGYMITKTNDNRKVLSNNSITYANLFE